MKHTPANKNEVRNGGGRYHRSGLPDHDQARKHDQGYPHFDLVSPGFRECPFRVIFFEEIKDLRDLLNCKNSNWMVLYQLKNAFYIALSDNI